MLTAPAETEHLFNKYPELYVSNVRFLMHSIRTMWMILAVCELCLCRRSKGPNPIPDPTRPLVRNLVFGLNTHTDIGFHEGIFFGQSFVFAGTYLL